MKPKDIKPSGEGRIIERHDSNPVVTVVLGIRDPTIRKDYHCHNCGRIVFNYYSELRIIVVGEMQEVSRPVDIMCSRCKIIHRVI